MSTNKTFNKVQLDVKFTQATSRVNLISEENISISFGKISKYFADLHSQAFTGYTHPTYTARTGKPTGNQTPGFGSTFTISQITSDGTGHVTAATDRTVKIPDTTMGAASADAAGSKGLVPAPAAGKQTSFLRGDGTWVVPTNTTYSAGAHLSLSSTTFSLASYCKSITDWNNATTNGWYMGSSVTNAPSTAWWFGRVIAHNNKYCMQEVWQFTTSTDGHKVPHKMRMFVNNVWGNWVDVTVGTQVPENAVFTDTKVTSSANHYTPATASGQDKTASASGATAAWSIDVVKGVTLNTDGKGHVTGLSVTSGKIPANPVPSNNVTGSGTSGYLTKWNGTNTITNGPQLGSSTTTYLRNDGTWATPTNTNTTYTLGTSGNNVTLTPSSGSVQSITVPYASNAAQAIKLRSAAARTDSTVDTADTTPYQKYWVKIASCCTTGNWADLESLWAVNDVYGNRQGILKVRARVEGTAGTFGNTRTIRWIVADSDIDVNRFAIVCYNNRKPDGTTASGTATVELWWKSTSQYASFSFVLLDETRRTGKEPNDWVLYDTSTYGQAALPTTGNITYSVAATILNSTTGNAATATSATTASKLGSSTIGSTRRPIYLNSGTATETNYMVSHFGNAGKSNMNDVGRMFASVGMTNLSDPGNTVDNPMNGTTKSTSWHLYWDACYSDDPSGSNGWVAQIANKAGSAQWWVRSRQGGTITNGTEWAAGWEHLTITSQAGAGSATNPVYVDSNGHTQACTYSLNKSVPSNALFTDANVTQTPADSTYTNYRPLLIGNSSGTSAGFTPTLTTAGVYATAGIYCKPSSGYVYASDFMTNTYPSGTGSSLSQYGLYLKSYFKCADSSQTVLQYAGYGVRTYSGKITSSDGMAVAVGGGGLTVLGGGESAHNLISLISDDQKISGNTTLNVGGTLNTTFVGNTEVAIVSSDDSIYFITNCQTIANRKPVCLNTSSYFYPGTNKTGSIGTSSYMWNSVYAATIYENGTSLASKYAAIGHTHGLLHSDLTQTASNGTTGGWSVIGIDPTVNGYVLKSIRINETSPNWLSGGYGAGIAFGGYDTKGVISMRWDSPVITFAGGNHKSTITSPKWYFKISGTSGSTYDLANFNAATATTASKLSNTSAIGSSTQPVYFNKNGVPVACTQDANKAHFSTVPFVKNDGVMEVGRYFDMHSTNTGTTDYDVRLDASDVSSFRFTFNTPTSSSIAPSTNNQTSLGTSSLKWSNVYATTFYGALSGNASTATRANYINVVAGNEIRFYNDNQFTANKHFWLGYSWADGSHYTPSGGSDTSSTTAPNITKFIMGNCSAGGLASVHAKTFILGNGSSPTNSSKTTTIATAATTTDRTITLPNASGTVALLTKGSTSFWGLIDGDGSAANWIRATSNGFIPSAEARFFQTATSSLGTNTWYFKNSYIQYMNANRLILGAAKTADGAAKGQLKFFSGNASDATGTVTLECVNDSARTGDYTVKLPTWNGTIPIFEKLFEGASNTVSLSYSDINEYDVFLITVANSNATSEQVTVTSLWISNVAGIHDMPLIWGGAPTSSGGSCNVTSGWIQLSKNSGTTTFVVAHKPSVAQMTSSGWTISSPTYNLYIRKIFGLKAYKRT